MAVAEASSGGLATGSPAVLDRSPPCILGIDSSCRRGVAKPGNAGPLGGRDPRFESGGPDCLVTREGKRTRANTRKALGLAECCSLLFAAVRGPRDRKQD